MISSGSHITFGRFCTMLGLALGLMLMGVSAIQAQDFEKMRADLKKKQQNTRTEIQDLKDQVKLFESEISQANLKFEKLNSEYEKITRQIALRNKLIEKLGTESRNLNEQISITGKQISEQEKDLDRLIDNYKNTLTYLYKHGRRSNLAVILTASSFNQMLRRAFYLEKFKDFRTKQAVEIEEARKTLEARKVDLETAKEKNEATRAETQREKDALAGKVRKQKSLISSLKKNRSKLRSRLKKTEGEIENLRSTLDDLIAEEVRVRKAEEDRLRALEAERLRQLAEAQKIRDAGERQKAIERLSKPVTETRLLSESDVRNIESSFAKARGGLPWPVEKGAVSAKFGTKVHPVYGTKVSNLGIEIATEPRSTVQVIHDGQVYGVQPIPGYGDVVIVNHGKYYSVYGNLSEVYARKNTALKAGDIIGLSGDENSAKGSAVFLMIRENNRNLDPEKWIARR